MARVAAALGAGVPEAGGRTTGAVDGAVGLSPGLRVGALARLVAAGVDVWPAAGVARALAVGLPAGPPLPTGEGTELGAELGAGVGTAITKTVVPTLSAAGPIATAWPAFDGEMTTELGTVGKVARLREIPASGAQSGSSPVGQTLSTLAVTSARPPEPLVTTQVTSDVGTASGVSSGPSDGAGAPLPEARAIRPAA